MRVDKKIVRGEDVGDEKVKIKVKNYKYKNINYQLNVKWEE